MRQRGNSSEQIQLGEELFEVLRLSRLEHVLFHADLPGALDEGILLVGAEEAEGGAVLLLLLLAICYGLHGCFFQELLDHLCGLYAIHLWHTEVHKDDFVLAFRFAVVDHELALLDHLQSLHASKRALRLHTKRFEHVLECVHLESLVVDN